MAISTNITLKRKFLYDHWLIVLTFFLLAFGLLMVSSASMVISDQQFHTPFHFMIHQLAYICIGLIMGAVVTKIPILFWERVSPYLLLISIVFLVAILVPGVGRHVNGSVRWIGIGPFGLQVSEFAKFSIIIYMAGYLVRRQQEVRSDFTGFLKPMLLLTVIASLLLLEPDFGAMTVIIATVMGMMFLAGARLREFVLLLFVILAALVMLAITSPYRLLRLTTFLHPWSNQYNSGYQLTQSLIAFGRGGIFGVGLGNSVQKLFYLPEAHTDFLFAVLGEELGLIGGMVIIGLFCLLVMRIFKIGRTANAVKHYFSAYAAYGIAFWFGLQAFVNIGVNTGLLPTKGLTLPLMSYGGSSMMISFIAIAFLLRIHHEVVKS